MDRLYIGWFTKGCSAQLDEPSWNCVETGGSGSQTIKRAEYLPLTGIFFIGGLS